MCVYSATYTWTGSAGDGKWSSAGNWSGSVVPGINDTIQFSAGQSAVISLTENVSVAGALIYNTTGTVTFNLNGYSLSVGNGGTAVGNRFNLGSSTGTAASQGGHVIMNGPGSVSAEVFDSSQLADCSLVLNNGVSFTVSGTIYANGSALTTISGDSSCSFILPPTYNSTDSTNVIEFAGAMSVISKIGTYTFGLLDLPAVGAAVTVRVTSSVNFTQLKYSLTVKNTNNAVRESYTIDGTSYNSDASVTKNVSPVLSSGLYVYTFEVVFPAVMDSGDGISLVVHNSGGVNLGTLLFYAPILSTTTVWTGAVNSDWSNVLNWSNGVPSLLIPTVVIPAVTAPASFPELDRNIQTGVKKITIAAGAELSLNGKNAAGASFVNNGTVLLTGAETGLGAITNGTASTVVYTGGGAFPVWGSDYVNLIVNAGSVLTFNKNIGVTGLVTNNGSLVLNTFQLSFAVYGGSRGTVSVSGGTLLSKGAGGTVDSLTVINSATIDGGSGGLSVTSAAYNGSKLNVKGNVSLSSGSIGILTVSGGNVSLAGGSAASELILSAGSFETEGALSSGSVSLANGTSFTINGTVSVGGNWTDNGASFIHNSNTVVFSDTAVISGTTSFYDMTMVGAGGKVLTVNGAISVSNMLTLSGSALSNLLAVTGSGSIRLAFAQMTGNFLDVSPVGPEIRNFVYTAISSTPADGTAPAGWNILSGALSYVWNGNSSVVWTEKANWNTGIAPLNDGTSDIRIPAGCVNWPRLQAAVHVDTLIVDAGAEIDLTRRNVTVVSAFENGGAVRLTGVQTVSGGTVTNLPGSTVEYYGAGTATCLFGSSFDVLKTSAGKSLDFNAFSVTAATLTVAGGLTLKADAFTLTSGGSAAGDVSVICNDVELGGMLAAGTNNIEIYPYNTTRAVSLGAAAAGSLSLSAAELAFISTSGTLTIGNDTVIGALNVASSVSFLGVTGTVFLRNGSGGIAVSAELATAGDLSLISGGSVTGTAAISVNGGGGILAVSAGTGIVLNAAAGNAASGVALENTTSGSVVYTGKSTFAAAVVNSAASGLVSVTGNSGNMQITSVSGVNGMLSGITSAGDISVACSVGTVSVAASLDASGSITVNALSLTLNADVVASGSGSSVTFNCPITVSDSVSVKAENGNIDFTSTIDCSVSGTYTLNVVAGTGTVSAVGTVGALKSLARFDVTAGLLKINGESVSADIQMYDTDVEVFAAIPVRFNGSVTIGSGKTFIGRTGLVTFNGTVTNNGTVTSGSAGIVFIDSITGGTLKGIAGAVLTVNNAASADFEPAVFLHNGSGFELKGIGSVVIGGGYTFNSFTCTQAGKVISFKAGEVQTVSGAFTVTGAAGSPVSLQSTVSPSMWFINVASTNANVSFAAIKDSESYDVLVPRVLNSTGSNTINWLSCVYTWRGTVDSDWNETGNWTVGTVAPRPPSQIPLSDSAVCEIVISNTASSNPLILTAASPSGGAAGLITLKSLTIKGGASFETQGRNITAQSVTNGGSVTVKGTESFNFAMLSNAVSSTVTYKNDGASVSPVWARTGVSSVTYGNLIVQGSYSGGSGTAHTVLQTGNISISVSGLLTNYGCIEINGTGSVSKTDGVRGKFIYSAPTRVIRNYTDIAGAYDYYDLAVAAGMQSSSANLAVRNDVTVSGGTLSLSGDISAGGTVLNTASVSLSGGASVSSAGDIDCSIGSLLVNGGNSSISASSSGSSVMAGSVSVATGSSLSIKAAGSVIIGSGCGTGTGILELKAPGLTVNDAISVDTLILSPLNTVAQTYSVGYAVNAGKLLLNASGSGVPSFILDNSTNRIGSVAASGSADITVHTELPLVCSSVADFSGTAVDGISASGRVTFISLGAVSQTEPLECSVLTVSSGGAITLSDTLNKIAFLGPVNRAGAFSLSDSDGGLGIIGVLGAASSGVSSVRIQSTGGVLELNAAIGESGTVTLVNTDDSITQSVPLSAGTLVFQAGGNVTLADSANSFVSVNGTGNNVTVTDADGYTVTSLGIAATGDVLLSCGAGPITLQNPVTSSGGTITVRAGSLVNLNYTGTVLDTSVGGTGYGITLDSPVVLGADAVISSRGGGIVFSGTVMNSVSGKLTLSAGSGAVTFTGAVGSGTPLAALNITASSVFINGGSVSAGTQTYTANVMPAAAIPVTLSGLVTLAAGKTFTGGSALAVFAGAVVNNGSIRAGSGGIRFESSYSGAAGTLADNAAGSVVFDNTTANPLTVHIGTYTANGGILTFSGSAGYNFIPGSSVYGSVSFLNASGVVLAAASIFRSSGTVTIGGGTAASLDFESNNAGFVHSWSSVIPDFIVRNGTVRIGTGTFVCGNLTVAAGSSFTQTGANAGTPAALQSVQAMTNDGVLTWDSSSAGGYLSLYGNSSGANAYDIAFNKKNVSVNASLTLSGVFYDLSIPAGITVTNGFGIRIKRHFTVNGRYVDNSRLLTLGGSGSDSAEIQDNGIVLSSFGSLVVEQGASSKSFLTDIKAASVSIAGGSGAVLFSGSLETVQFLNAGGNFNLSFNGAGGGQSSSVGSAVTINTAGIVSFGNDASDSFTVNGILAVSAAANEIRMGGSLTALSVSLNRKVLLSADTAVNGGNGTVLFDSDVDGGYDLRITAGTGSVLFTGAVGNTVAPASLTVVSANTAALNGGSIKTAGAQTYNSAVTLGMDTVVATVNGSVLFKGTVNGAYDFNLNSGTADTVFEGAVGDMQPLSDVYITAGKTDIRASFTINGSFTAYNSNTFRSFDSADISAGGAIILTGTAPSGSYQLAGSVVSSGGAISIGGTASAPVNVYLYTSSSGTVPIQFSSGTGFTVMFYGNLFAAASGKTVVFDSPVSVTGSFVTYGVPVRFGSRSTGIDCTQDVVLLGSAYTVDDAVSGVAGLFLYNHAARTLSAGYAPASLLRSSLFPGNLPDGSILNLLAEPVGGSVPYENSAVFNPVGLEGKQIRVGKNFYANGVVLETSAVWTLSIPDNGKKSVSFAEAYNTAFRNCKVINNTSGGTHASVAAAENCTDNDFNVGIAFDRPYLLADNGGNAADTVGTPNRSGTYTVYDDVIRLEFRDKSGAPVLMENSENEISKALAQIRFNGGSFAGQSGGQRAFTGAFTDADCTDSTDGKGDIAVFYLQITDAQYRWNTDAAGTSAGDADSTDRGRSGLPAMHRTAVPNLDIPKALASVYATLCDENKNRIAHYHDNAGNMDSADGSEINAAPLTQGKIFAAVTDRCAPVLISVRTGQELHSLETSSVPAAVPNQKSYDAHNFIEFQYSEPVDIGDLTAAGGDVNVQVQNSFGSISEHGGSITGAGTVSGGSGLTITGFGAIHSGTLVTGSRNTVLATAQTVHSLYRSFSLTGADAGAGIAAAQPHRVRLGIASFVSGTVIQNNTVFHNWIGYIDEGILPAGSVTRIKNEYIVDLAVSPSGRLNNTLSHAGTVGHALPELSVNSSTTELYGIWDNSPPVFAKFAGFDRSWESDSLECEIIGSGHRSDGSTGTTISQIEFHLFDNTPLYISSETYQWVSKRGWLRGSADEQVARDISGGSRAFISQSGVGVQNKTSGGIRAASLENAAAAFSYRCNVQGLDSSLKSFAGSIDQKYYTNYLFDAVEHPTISPSSDGLYFIIPLKNEDSSAFPLRSSFDIMYDSESSYITDLAGNRMKSVSVTSIDRTPPSFSLTVAPIKTDKLYVVFSKQIRCMPADLEKIPSQLELTDSTGVLADIKIDASVAAVPVKQTSDGTGLVFTLNRSVTLDDVRQLRVRVKQPASMTIDPLTGLPDYIPEIYDTKGNAMISLSAHTLSDFAVNVVNVMYAFDGKGSADSSDALLGEGVYGSVYDEYNWAVRDFSGSGNNTGRMLTDSDITVAVRVTDGTQTNGKENAAANITFKLIAAVTYPPDTVSDAYNKHTGSSLRVWLPTELSSLSSRPNTNVKYVGEYAPDADTQGFLRNFVIPNTDGSFGWTAGQEVQFLFALYDSSDPPIQITINHDADANTPEVPLYALCLSADRRGVQTLPSAEMVTTLDLWSFKLADKVKQRGGVTILNNVINASAREETVVEVDMVSAGNLTVQVLTLDGNIVKTLQKGRATAGLHYYRWNGTNNNGSPVARGMYFVRITGSGFDETRKVMVIKE